ncbi:hypothetical protein TrVE_jg3663 [Triparma verrucosa]|uniref:Uncharacterized protein n=1 Tax=Triparma verrucosa TaxID=1606542 RepID=A0A9W7EXN0_9STRA|nr:hypothetical protein TrVE_jg3663 [Triparma verrucosa]
MRSLAVYFYLFTVVQLSSPLQLIFKPINDVYKPPFHIQKTRAVRFHPTLRSTLRTALRSSSSDSSSDSNLPDPSSSLLLSSLKDRLTTLQSESTTLTCSYLNGDFKTTSFDLPSYIRRISLNYPLCGFGLYDGNVGLLDLRTAEIICITETYPHPTSRNGRESDKVDEAIVCLNGEYDGGGVTSIDLQLGVMVTGGRDGRVYVWELRGLRKEGFEFGRPKPHVLRAGGVVGGVLIGEDNDVITTNTFGTVRIFTKAQDGEYEERTKRSFDSPILCVVKSPLESGGDGRSFWVGLDDGRIIRLDGRTLKTEYELKAASVGVRSLFQENDVSVIVGCNDGGLFRVTLAGDDVEPIQIKPGHSEAVVSIVSPSPGVVATASRDGNLRFWGTSSDVPERMYDIGPMRVWLSGIGFEGNVLVTDGADNKIIMHTFDV